MKPRASTHDWANWETCQCGERGCGSYRPFPGGPTTREMAAERAADIGRHRCRGRNGEIIVTEWNGKDTILRRVTAAGMYGLVGYRPRTTHTHTKESTTR